MAILRWMILGSLVLILPRDAFGQLAPGSRVRVTVARDRVVGEFVEVRDGQLRLGGLGGRELESRTFGIDTIQRLELSRGRRSHWLLGLGVGAGFGAVGGALTVSSFGGGSGSGTAVARATIVWGGIGALVGGLWKTESWQQADLKRLGVAVGVRPQHDGVSFVIRLAVR
jgi:hypothetical protein